MHEQCEVWCIQHVSGGGPEGPAAACDGQHLKSVRLCRCLVPHPCPTQAPKDLKALQQLLRAKRAPTAAALVVDLGGRTIGGELEGRAPHELSVSQVHIPCLS